MKAVIPIAGRGTRMFPITNVIPKAFLPLVDRYDGLPKPALHLIVDEAIRAGISKACLVVNDMQQRLMRDYLAGLKGTKFEYISHFIELVEQKEPLGFGHAVYCARRYIGNDYFMVMLGDHVYYQPYATQTCAGALLEAFEVSRRSITSVGMCSEQEVISNGILKCNVKDTGNRILTILDMIEKPSASLAKQSLRSAHLHLGQYHCNFGIDILSPNIFPILEKNIKKTNANVEIQLRDAMKQLWKSEGMDAFYEPTHQRFDFGLPHGYRDTFMAFANPTQLCKEAVPQSRTTFSHPEFTTPGHVGYTTREFSNLIHSNCKDFFGNFEHVHVSRAPGRIDVMGGIGDYSGCTVLQLPTQEATFAAVQKKLKGGALHIKRFLGDGNCVSASISDLRQFKDMPYKEIQDFFKSRFASSPWVAYICGVLIVFSREVDNSILENTTRIAVSSSVPESRGVSSSAAIEVAIAYGIVAAYQLRVDKKTIALLCQKAENLIVGAACGVMDQVVCTYGEGLHFTALACQPIKDIRNIRIPANMAVWGLNSGVPRSTASAAYMNTRIAAFMGHRIITHIDKRACVIKNGIAVAENDQWKGHLANISPEIFERTYAQNIPKEMLGADFISQYGGTIDVVTKIDPHTTYNVYEATKHPIYENYRIKQFIQQLSTSSLEELGNLMYASHDSYSTCGLGSINTNLLVELVKQAGPASDLYGARVTGGGGGGTVVVLGKNSEKANAALQAIQTKYKAKTGIFPQLFSGSSDGASKFGSVVLPSQH